MKKYKLEMTKRELMIISSGFALILTENPKLLCFKEAKSLLKKVDKVLGEAANN